MKNRIHLEKFNVRTDLIIDEKIESDIVKKKKISDNLTISNIEVTKNLSTLLQKKEGTYVTLEFQDITNHEDAMEVEKYLKEELIHLFSKLKIKDGDSCLVIGLGNKQSTADSLGPNSVEKIMVTRHLFVLGTNVKDGIRMVSAISPGVMANTGIETSDIILGIVKNINPDFLIVIDALASSSISRINQTIQITDTGIHPGSGVGNNRREISLETIGKPVIAIGVPTVVESSILVNDTIDYLFKHLSYIKNHYQENKLIFSRNSKRYLEQIEEQNLSKQEKTELSGILGTIDDEEKRELIMEVLNSIGYNMIVTPKEIDFLVEKLSDVISGALNQSLHLEVNENEKKENT